MIATTIIVSIGIIFFIMMLLTIYCISVISSMEKEMTRTHNGVLQNRKHIAELSYQLHSMRDRQLTDSKKIGLINEFCIEYSWRLVHFSDDELINMAKDEAERQGRLEDDTTDTWAGSTGKR